MWADTCHKGHQEGFVEREALALGNCGEIGETLQGSGVAFEWSKESCGEESPMCGDCAQQGQGGT